MFIKTKVQISTGLLTTDDWLYEDVYGEWMIRDVMDVIGVWRGITMFARDLFCRNTIQQVAEENYQTKQKNKIK